MSRAFGAWLQSKGLARRARRHHDAERPAISDRDRRHAARRLHGRERQSALHGARTRASSSRTPAPRPSSCSRTSPHTLEHAIGKTDVKHIVVAAMGDLLGLLKGTIVNLVVRQVKKMVPAYSLPGRDVVQRRHCRRQRHDARRRRRSGPTTSPSCNTPAAPRASPRARCCSHRNIVANTLQIDAWLQPMLAKEPKVDRLTIMAALPLYHIFALTACFLLGMRTGGRNILIPNPRDIPGLIKELTKYRVNLFPAVNTLYNALLNHSDFGQDRLEHAEMRGRRRHGGAAGGCGALVQGHRLSDPEGYGLSETSPVLTCNPPTQHEWTGTIGLPMPSTDISIRDDDNNEVALGQPGEICASGPQVMPGYWNRPDETAKVMTPDGYFRTGDIGIMDENGQVTHRRPQEGHDLGLGLQGLSQRSRGRGREPSGRARMRRRRRTGRALRRGGEAVRRQEGPGR